MSNALTFSSFKNPSRFGKENKGGVVAYLVLFVATGVFTVLTIPIIGQVRTYTSREHSTQQLTLSIFFTTTFIAFALCLRCYVLWVSGVAENAQSNETEKHGNILMKWIQFLKFISILAAISAIFTFLARGISFKPNLSSGLSITFEIVAFALAIFWFRIYKTAPEWIKAVQKNYSFEESMSLVNQVKIVTIFTIISSLMTFTRNILGHRFLLFGAVTLLSTFALLTIFSASIRFIEATSAPG